MRQEDCSYVLLKPELGTSFFYQSILEDSDWLINFLNDLERISVSHLFFLSNRNWVNTIFLISLPANCLNPQLDQFFLRKDVFLENANANKHQKLGKSASLPLSHLLHSILIALLISINHDFCVHPFGKKVFLDHWRE